MRGVANIRRVFVQRKHPFYERGISALSRVAGPDPFTLAGGCWAATRPLSCPRVQGAEATHHEPEPGNFHVGALAIRLCPDQRRHAHTGVYGASRADADRYAMAVAPQHVHPVLELSSRKSHRRSRFKFSTEETDDTVREALADLVHADEGDLKGDPFEDVRLNMESDP